MGDWCECICNCPSDSGGGGGGGGGASVSEIIKTQAELNAAQLAVDVIKDVSRRNNHQRYLSQKILSFSSGKYVTDADGNKQSNFIKINGQTFSPLAGDVIYYNLIGPRANKKKQVYPSLNKINMYEIGSYMYTKLYHLEIGIENLINHTEKFKIIFKNKYKIKINNGADLDIRKDMGSIKKQMQIELFDLNLWDSGIYEKILLLFFDLYGVWCGLGVSNIRWWKNEKFNEIKDKIQFIMHFDKNPDKAKKAKLQEMFGNEAEEKLLTIFNERKLYNDEMIKIIDSYKFKPPEEQIMLRF